MVFAAKNIASIFLSFLDKDFVKISRIFSTRSAALVATRSKAFDVNEYYEYLNAKYIFCALESAMCED